MAKANAGAIAKERAETFQKLYHDGIAAQQELQTLNALGAELEGVSGKFPTGTWRGMAARMGIPVEGRTELQVIGSMIDRLTPTQRQGLPGAASDRDIAMFRGSLPSLLNTADGNRTILRNLTAMAQGRELAGKTAAEAFGPNADPGVVWQKLQGLGNPIQKAQQDAQERRFTEIQGVTNIDLRPVATMDDQRLRSFQSELNQRFPAGVPRSIREVVEARAAEIRRVLGR
jgi:flagellar protein FlgJ